MAGKKGRSIVWIIISAATIGFFVICVVFALCAKPLLAFILLEPFTVHETNNVADYGVITGNYDNKTPKEFIFSFFPAQIDDDFENVTYHYKAIKGDTYAYEVYLEFTIAEKERYDAFIDTVVDKDTCTTFEYAPDYQEYIVANCFMLVEHNPPNDSAPYIEDAEVGRVLFSDSEQKIIFIALGMFDGGGTNADQLGYYFNKFDIDPIDFEKQAWSNIH